MSQQKRVNGIADIKVIDSRKEIEEHESPLGKQFLRVTFEDGVQVNISFNLAEMIGGVGKGCNLRFGYTTEASYQKRKH